MFPIDGQKWGESPIFGLAEVGMQRFVRTCSDPTPCFRPVKWFMVSSMVGFQPNMLPFFKVKWGLKPWNFSGCPIFKSKRSIVWNAWAKFNIEVVWGPGIYGRTCSENVQETTFRYSSPEGFLDALVFVVVHRCILNSNGKFRSFLKAITRWLSTHWTALLYHSKWW